MAHALWRGERDRSATQVEVEPPKTAVQPYLALPTHNQAANAHIIETRERWIEYSNTKRNRIILVSLKTQVAETNLSYEDRVEPPEKEVQLLLPPQLYTTRPREISIVTHRDRPTDIMRMGIDVMSLVSFTKGDLEVSKVIS